MKRILLLSALSFVLTSIAGAATMLAPGVFLVPGLFEPNMQPDGNTVIFEGRKGLVVVDTGRHPEHTQAIIDFARQLHKPVTAIVNTHWHLDHISGNRMLRSAFPGVRVYASGALREALTGFLADEHKQLEQMIVKSPDERQMKELRAELATLDAAPSLAPDEVIAASGRRKLAGRTLAIHFESHAVTAGDLWLFDPATRILVAGDLVTLPVPFLDTACAEHWKASLDRLAKADFQLLVPGHGAPMDRHAFETYRTAFNNLLSCIASTRGKEECVNGWLTDAGPLLTYEPRFVKGLLDDYIDSNLRGSAASKAKLCGPA